MKAAVLGAGSIGLAYAAILASRGHEPVLWSPSGRGAAAIAAGASLQAKGAVEGHFGVTVATDCKAAVQGADAVIIAVPAYGHRTVMDTLAPLLASGQPVIISSHYSLGALYLSRLLALHNVRVPIAAWSTTAATARRGEDATVAVSGLRKQVDIAAFGGDGPAMVDLSKELFGDRFVLGENLLAVALSNLNPPSHMANALCNFTRIERGEDWASYDGITPAVGRLIEALDHERLAVADAYGLKVRTISDHLRLSFPQAEGESVADMAAAIHKVRNGPAGPRTTDTRFVTEDVPFGLVPLIVLARATKISVPLHQAGVALFSALYGRDFASENDLLTPLGLDTLDAAQLHDLLRQGWSA